jgi:hypothetical protein
MGQSRYITIPFVPPTVDLYDLHSNGMLMNPDAINEAKKTLKEKYSKINQDAKHEEKYPMNSGDLAGVPDDRYTKKNIKTPYSIAVINGQMYAIYKGAKKRKALGAGAFGKVKLAQNLETGEWAVLKVIKHNPSDDFGSEIIQADKEIESLNALHLGMNINYYTRKNKKGVDQIEIVMPLAQGMTVKAIANNRQMPAVNWLHMGKRILQCIQNLHRLGLYHRDIKPDNMLYESLASLATPVDLGFAIQITHAQNRGQVGTKYFMAPELNGKGKKEGYTYTEATETYALGVTLAYTYGLELIWDDVDSDYGSVDLNESVHFKRNFPDPRVREEILKCLYGMLQTYPESRSTLALAIQQIDDIEKNYFKSHLNVMSQINKLAYLPVAHLAKMIQGRKRDRQLGMTYSEILQALKNVDAVQLIGKDIDVAEARFVKHALQIKGVQVLREALAIQDVRNIAGELRENTALLEKQYGHIYHAFYLRGTQGAALSSQKDAPEDTYTVKEIVADPRAKKSAKYYKQHMQQQMQHMVESLIIADEHLQKIKEQIQQQHNGLKDDDPRKAQLTSFLASLAVGDKHYGGILQRLYALEKEVMAKSKGITKIIEKIGIRATSTTQLVYKTTQEIEKDLGFRKRK